MTGDDTKLNALLKMAGVMYTLDLLHSEIEWCTFYIGIYRGIYE